MGRGGAEMNSRLQAFIGAVGTTVIFGLIGCAAPVEEQSPDDSSEEAPAERAKTSTVTFWWMKR